jgi:hypothetical protein
MKTRTFRTCLFASLGAASLVALNATAQTQEPTPTASAAPAPADSAPVKLPYGVEDVLKLSRAQVSEDVTLNYIRNSGTIYNLAPKDIVYLRQEGVSDRVLNTMLDQRKNVPAETAAQSAPAAPQAPASPDTSAAPVPEYAPAYTQPAPVYVQPEPVYSPASSLYVIPYPYAGYRYPGSYPYYYGGYYGYGGPSVVFGFGYGSRGYCGPYYGRYHGRYYGGGHYGYHGHH